MAINKVLILRALVLFCYYFACIVTLCELSYFFDPWKIVLNVFSFPTLLARVTYMSYGGRGKEEVKRISVTPCPPPPPTGWGEGRRLKGPIFRLIPPVSHTLWFEYYVLPDIIYDFRIFEFFQMSSFFLIHFYAVINNFYLYDI